jgi:hypothetical protein
MNMNSGQLPTYKTLSPVLRTQTTYQYGSVMKYLWNVCKKSKKCLRHSRIANGVWP